MERALKSLFEKRFGAAPSIAPLPAHGSNRSLFRLSGAGRTVVGAYGPDQQENATFLAFSRHFRKCGLPVPEIYGDDDDAQVYIEQDLGDTTLFEFLTKNRGPNGPSDAVVSAYEKVVALLPRFQIEAGKTLDYRSCYPRSAFDRQSMAWDLNYFKYYFLRLAKIPFNEQLLEDDFTLFADHLLAADREHFLYRDFQSRNVMIVDGAPWFIDYQGGRKGALQYDIASLLFDAKADLPFELRERLLAKYVEAAGVDRKRFLEHYPGYCYIRIMQAMGAYGLRGFYEGKSHFLASIPYAIRNLEYLLRTTELPVELPELSAVFRRLVASSALRRFGSASLRLTVRIQSFSYKNGMPGDEKGHGGGFVFDCRALPNPGRFERYSKMTGEDADVIGFFAKEKSIERFLGHVYALVDEAVENYKSRNFTDLMVSFGCTGGQHRSVYCAERLAKRLRERHGVDIEIQHRERQKILTDAPPL